MTELAEGGELLAASSDRVTAPQTIPNCLSFQDAVLNGRVDERQRRCSKTCSAACLPPPAHRQYTWQMTQAVGFPDGALAVQWHVALSLALQVKYLHAHHIGLHRGIKEAPCRPESALQATAIFPWRAPRAETPFKRHAACCVFFRGKYLAERR